jgi:hypothetical protein
MEQAGSDGVASLEGRIDVFASLQLILTASRRASTRTSDAASYREANMKAVTVAIVAVGLSTAAFAQNPVSRNPSERPDPDVQARFESLDRNQDRQISKVEARTDASLGSRFASVDTNGDGYLTELEFAASLRMQNPTRPEPIER